MTTNYAENYTTDHLTTNSGITSAIESRIQAELGPYLGNSVIKIDLQNIDQVWTADVVIDSNRGVKASRRKDESAHNLVEHVMGDLKIQFAMTDKISKNEIFLFNQQQEYDHYAETISASPYKTPMNLKVLVIEDDPTALLILEKSLKSLGCQVELSSDPEKAIEKVTNSSFDLVILDWCLPYMDGHQFLKLADEKLNHKNRGDFDAKTIPLVICSSKNANEINLPLVSNFIFCQYWNKQLPFSTVISSIELAIKNARKHKAKSA